MSVNIDKENIQKLYDIINNGQDIQSSIHEMGEEEYISQIESYEQELDKFKQRFGINKIGEGRDRITFTSGSLITSNKSIIIKISKSDGFMQNQEEIQIWKEMSEDARKYVAKLYDWGNPPQWIVQERVDQITSRDATKELTENLEDQGWVSSDIRPANVGERSGQPVLMDLGVGLRKI